MENNKKELLNRVLLLMNYDNKKTLNENRQIILNEQDSNDPIPSFNDMTGQAIWLNKQTNYNSKEFQNVWRNYITNVSISTLDNLLKTQKALFDKGYGPMSPGLYGFNKPNPGISNIPLENQIYALKQKNYNEKTKSGVIVPKPSPPQYNLMSGIVNLRSANLGDILYKTATQINNEYKKADQQKKEKTNEKKCYFKNKEEGDNFRLYVNSVYKNVAKEIDLDIKGDFCNTYINKAYDYKLPTGGSFKTVGEAYKFFISYDPKKAKADLLKISREDLGYGGDRLDAERDIKIQTKKAEAQKKSNDTSKALDNMDADEQKKYNEWKEKQLEKYDFSTFPTPTDYYMGKPNYGKITTWKEPNTGKVFFISGKSLEDIKNDIVNEVEFKNQQKVESEVLDNPLLVQIFGEEKLQDSIKNCKKENLLGFFKKVLNYQYKTNGNTIGRYAKDKQGNSYFVTWPKNEPIPCTDEFWDEYGIYIQLGGMLAVGLLTGGLSLPASTSLFIELAADSAINLYSLKKSYESGDEDAMKMDLSYVFLPILMASKPIKALLKSAKFGDKVISSVESKLKSIPQNATTSQVDNVIKNMTPEEQRVIKELGKDEYANEIQKVSKQTLDDLKKTAKGPIGRKLSNPLINLIVYGSPVAVFFVNKINNAYQKKTGKSLSKEEQLLWNKAISFLDEKSQNNLTNWVEGASKEQLTEITNSSEFKNAVEKTQNPKNLSVEEIEKQGQKILDMLKMVTEKSKLDLKTKDPENEDFIIDIPDEEFDNTFPEDKQ